MDVTLFGVVLIPKMPPVTILLLGLVFQRNASGFDLHRIISLPIQCQIKCPLVTNKPTDPVLHFQPTGTIASDPCQNQSAREHHFVVQGY